MSDQSTEKPKGQEPTPKVTQQPQASDYQPNREVKPPKYQLVTEGYDPRVDITWKDKQPKE